MHCNKINLKNYENIESSMDKGTEEQQPDGVESNPIHNEKKEKEPNYEILVQQRFSDLMKQKREKLTIDNNEKKEVEKIGKFKMFKLGKGFGFIKTYQGDAFATLLICAAIL